MMEGPALLPILATVVLRRHSVPPSVVRMWCSYFGLRKGRKREKEGIRPTAQAANLDPEPAPPFLLPLPVCSARSATTYVHVVPHPFTHKTAAQWERTRE